MKELTLQEPIELPIELTEAELDVVSGGQYTVSVQSINFFGLVIGPGGFAAATSKGVIAVPGTAAAVASGITGLTYTESGT